MGTTPCRGQQGCEICAEGGDEDGDENLAFALPVFASSESVEEKVPDSLGSLSGVNATDEQHVMPRTDKQPETMSGVPRGDPPEAQAAFVEPQHPPLDFSPSFDSSGPPTDKDGFAPTTPDGFAAQEGGYVYSGSGPQPRPGGSQQYGSEDDEHLVLRAIPPNASIFFIKVKILPDLPAPWPRCQELIKQHNSFAEPRNQDLVIAVSHMWYFQAHPDPMGEKAALVYELSRKANKVNGGRGDALLFFDFLSMTQRPFQWGQAPRTASETLGFAAALRAMPLIYLHSDAVILLELEDVDSAAPVPGDGDRVSVNIEELKHAKVQQINDTVQVIQWDGQSEGVVPFDSIISIDGEPASVDAVELLQKELISKRSSRASLRKLLTKTRTATIQKAPYGRRNLLPAAERGWIYLERFIAMVKVAMSGEGEEDKMVFSNSATLFEEIRVGGDRLRDAAKTSQASLRSALDEHFGELKRKTFSASSTDKMTNTGGVGGETQLPVLQVDSMSAGSDTAGSMHKSPAVASDPHSSIAQSDREVVESIMREMVVHLSAHWAEEVSALRKRRFRKAVKRLGMINSMSMFARATTIRKSTSGIINI